MKIRLNFVSVFCLMAFFTYTNAFSRLTENRKTVFYVTENVNIQKQLSKSDAIYIIECDIDLNGQIVQIPESSELKFYSKTLSNGTIRLNNHSKLVGNGVMFAAHPHQQMIFAEGVEDIEISGVTFNSVGNKHSSYESSGVFMTNCDYIKIHDCIFWGDSIGLSGFVGLVMLKACHVDIYNNTFKYFYKPDFWKSNQRNTAWATYLVSLKNAKIFLNTFYKTYSGIKLTGYIENVAIYSNETYDNITDGCDFAGISAKNVVIENNKFENSGDCGVEFKILFHDQWHSNEMKKYYGYDLKTPRFFQGITIRNNMISSWVGVKIWNQYNKSEALSKNSRYLGYNKRSGNIVILNNNLSKTKDGSGNPNSSVGIQVAYNATNQGDFKIFDNKIEGYKFGLYFVNSSYINVENNFISSLTYGIYERFEDNNDLMQTWNHHITIDGNKFKNKNSKTFLLSNRTKVWTIKNNKIYASKQANIIEDHGYSNIFHNNSIISNER